MRKALLFGLRTKLVDVVTALEAGLVNQPDAEHLRWVTGEGRVLYSYNTGDYNELHYALLARGKRFDGCCG